jgi:RNA polymerase sigma-70 factor (ECF subfamily)
MDEIPSKISEQLLEKLKRGDEDASDELVHSLYPLLQTTIRRHIRRSADHDDIAQEIFMKIFLKIDQYRGPQPFEHWASRLAVNTCYDWLRKSRARPLVTYSDLSEKESEMIAATLSGDLAGNSDFHRELLVGLLDKLIDGLKPREQIVIRLLDIEEQSIKNAAEITGWGESKVKTTAMRARRKLADRLRLLERSARST